MRWILAAAGVLGLATAAAADTLTVPSDDYPNLQAAADAAGTGDTILVLPGTYGAGADFAGKFDLRIVGKGRPLFDLDGGNALDFAACSGISVSGIDIHGANNGLYFNGCEDVRVDRVNFTNVNYEAIGISSAEGMVITRCVFDSVGGKGIEDNGSLGVVIDRCVFHDCAEGAVVLSPTSAPGAGSEGAQVTRCVITGPGPGIVAAGAGLLIDRNSIEVPGVGIDLDNEAAVDGAVVTRNRVVATQFDTAVEIFGTGTLLQRNLLSGGGIVEQGSANYVAKNTVKNADFGIAINGSSASIVGNHLADIGGHGIDLTSALHVVDKNVIQRCANSGIYASVQGSTFFRNRVTDAEYGIVVVYGTNQFLKNKVAGTTTLDLWDQAGEGANTYGKNAFRTTQFGD